MVGRRNVDATVSEMATTGPGTYNEPKADYFVERSGLFPPNE
jgi:hypothetical protein